MSEWSLNEDFNKESFKMLAWHRFVLWQQIIQSEPKRIRDSGGVQSVLMDIVEQQQKEWDELKNKREIMEEVMKTREDLAKKIRFVLNCASREGCTDTPDFILAEYMLSALECFETACRDREKWYGRQVDGFGNSWSKTCPMCHMQTMQIVRPGKVQCSICG